MNILEKLKELKFIQIFKIFGIFVLAIIFVSVSFALIKPIFNSSFLNKSNFTGSPSMDYAMTNSAPGSAGLFSPNRDLAEPATLSVRNIAQESVTDKSSPKTVTDVKQADDFEVTEYHSTIETNNLNKSCEKIVELKKEDYVIFENINSYDRGCDYVFKVKKDKTEEILAIIKGMKPKAFSENKYVIKKVVEDFTSQIDILKAKLKSIDETMKTSITAYDDVTKLATQAKDIESLSKIIDSRLNLIERLTQERININAELERIGRAKGEQLDRLEYDYFYLNIVENKLFNIIEIKDSWVFTSQEFVRNMNGLVQDITINFAYIFFLIFKFLIYALLILVVGKYSWKFFKNIWDR